ncbi:hypothetical protein MPDQ_001986 [Monascus purpureus]|uniref:MARVEL domain-containing protein n=1 Tax=Monascus purpureus TaxID=5098 RepID=A0A507QNX7_MONPU|nr:hypothetical protein MPDQ_001986 [Monascus purpureus]BDD59154.1 hypothetical protein MAP00_004385 [Monascus purpureus]
MLPWIYPVRAIQIVFAIIVLGLTAYAVGEIFDSPNTINYVLFVSVWTWIATMYLFLAPAYFPVLANRIAILAVEAVTMVFWFAGFIALGAWLPSPSFCKGDLCNSLQAATVFGSFEWALFAVTTGVVIYNFRRNSKPAPPSTVNLGV